MGLGLAAATGGTFVVYKVPLIGTFKENMLCNLIDWYLRGIKVFFINNMI